MENNFITILSRFGREEYNSKSKIYLTWDEWNDYSFRTLFGIFYIDDNSIKHDLGGVKIGFFGQAEGETILAVGDIFPKLPDDFFSLGSEFYYEALNKLGDTTRDKILFALNDLAKNTKLFEAALDEKVTKISLLRGITETEVTGQLKRMADGGSRLTPFKFQFEWLIGENSNKPINLTFNVGPESIPPTNVHVIIGRNGTGKTTLLNSIVKSLIYENHNFPYGKFVATSPYEEVETIPNLISVSFSAFDESDLHVESESISSIIKHTYIGLKKDIKANNNNIVLKSPNELKNEFLESLVSCKKNLKIKRWQDSISILESDPYFNQENIISLIEDDKSITDEIEREKRFKELAAINFANLSSGHKIVLLTITRLVETLEERSLLLIDEPETHLHPPLLSAFIRSLSQLLINRNGVAIIATHSPVILQEVPKSCVWKLIRNGSRTLAERLEIESFGENVGTLTREVFRLEVTESGFYKFLNDSIVGNENFEDLVEKFKGQLGLEAFSILRVLLTSKNRRDNV